MSAVISENVLDLLDRKTGEARALPNEAFTTDAFLALENQYLFAGVWVFAGVASAVPNPGDVEPVQVAGRSLFMARGGDGQVRVFQNVCPHRGARLVIESLRGVPALTCPYHGWSYDLTGELKGRPHFHGPDRHDRGNGGSEPVCLFEVQSAGWHDWVFVNLDGKADDFETFMGPVLSRLGEYQLEAFHCARHMTFEFACNWKIAVENYCDSYHVFNVHPALNEMHPPEERVGMRPAGRHLFNGFHFAGPGRGLTIDAEGPMLPNLPGLSADQTTEMTWTTVFPNTTINMCPSHLQFIQFVPSGVERSVMNMWFYFVNNAAEAPEHEEARELLYDEWTTLNAEDEGVCQRLQQGRACDAYDGGRLAPYWDAGTVHFHRQIAHAIRGGRD